MYQNFSSLLCSPVQVLVSTTVVTGPQASPAEKLLHLWLLVPVWHSRKTPHLNLNITIILEFSSGFSLCSFPTTCTVFDNSYLSFFLYRKLNCVVSKFRFKWPLQLRAPSPPAPRVINIDGPHDLMVGRRMVLQLPIMGALTNDSHDPSESWLELILYHKLQTSSKNVTKMSFSAQCRGSLDRNIGNQNFRPYLLRREFTWLTDCSGLSKFFTGDDIPTHMIQRWRMQLFRYDFTIEHRPGRMLFKYDLLSHCNVSTQEWREEEK